MSCGVGKFMIRQLERGERVDRDGFFSVVSFADVERNFAHRLNRRVFSVCESYVIELADKSVAVNESKFDFFVLNCVRTDFFAEFRLAHSVKSENGCALAAFVNAVIKTEFDYLSVLNAVSNDVRAALFNDKRESFRKVSEFFKVACNQSVACDIGKRYAEFNFSVVNDYRNGCSVFQSDGHSLGHIIARAARNDRAFFDILVGRNEYVIPGSDFFIVFTCADDNNACGFIYVAVVNVLQEAFVRAGVESVSFITPVVGFARRVFVFRNEFHLAGCVINPLESQSRVRVK